MKETVARSSWSGWWFSSVTGVSMNPDMQLQKAHTTSTHFSCQSCKPECDPLVLAANSEPEADRGECEMIPFLWVKGPSSHRLTGVHRDAGSDRGLRKGKEGSLDLKDWSQSHQVYVLCGTALDFHADQLSLTNCSEVSGFLGWTVDVCLLDFCFDCLVSSSCCDFRFLFVLFQTEMCCGSSCVAKCDLNPWSSYFPLPSMTRNRRQELETPKGRHLCLS